MTSPFVEHQIGVLIFVVVLMLIALSNIKGLRPITGYPRPSRFPRVSVLVPARNEELNIGLCVDSLLSQNYPDYELVVLDDESQDSTGDILAEIAVRDSRLRIARGSALPEGWLGKNWACHNLSLLANGSLLLFVDADTIHHPEAIRSAVSALLAERADLLTAIPREEVVTWAERLVVPVIPWSINSFLPVSLAHRVRWPLFSAAIGQFMLFNRQAYEAIGGHASVRNSTVDDIALARLIKASGYRWRLVDGTHRVQCRMYRSPADVIRGISRSLFGVFGSRAIVHLFVWFWLSVVFIEPLVVLLLALSGLPGPANSLRLAAATISVSLILWGIAYVRFDIPRGLVIMYPATILVVTAIAVLSVANSVTGNTTWKGRRIGSGNHPPT